MNIHFSPILMDRALTLFKEGDKLTINGETFDFTDLPDGATIPPGIIPSEWIFGAVERIEEAVRITVFLPRGPLSPPDEILRQPIIDAPDGPISLPGGTNVEA